MLAGVWRYLEMKCPTRPDAAVELFSIIIFYFTLYFRFNTATYEQNGLKQQDRGTQDNRTVKKENEFYS